MSFRLGSFINKITDKIPTGRKKSPKSPKPPEGGRLRKLLQKTKKSVAAPTDEQN
jgi:hypothetical protein